jgi:fructose-bisphosphate aldolase class I
MTTHFNYPSQTLQSELRSTATILVSPGKGILAADQSINTMGKRLKDISVENTEENRRLYRNFLFTTNKEISKYISGVILSPEAHSQQSDDGKPFIKHIQEHGLLPGVKVDTGIVPLTWSEDGESSTQGLDGLSEKCAQFKKDGFKFTKFRSSLKIGKNIPSYLAMLENANVLARFASISQAQGLVPIVEPDVMPDGDYDLDRSQKVSETVLSFVLKALHDHHVFLEGMLLKPSMVTGGLSCPSTYTPLQIGK